MKKVKTAYSCDKCGVDLPDDYVSTDTEGYQYFARNAYDEIPLTVPVTGCASMVVHVRLGGKHDSKELNDLCDTCRLDLLKQAVDYMEQKVGGV